MANPTRRYIAFTIASPRSVPGRRESPVRWRLIPRDEAFFESFVKTASEIRFAATLFQEMVGAGRAALGPRVPDQRRRAPLR